MELSQHRHQFASLGETLGGTLSTSVGELLAKDSPAEVTVTCFRRRRVVGDAPRVYARTILKVNRHCGEMIGRIH